MQVSQKPIVPGNATNRHHPPRLRSGAFAGAEGVVTELRHQCWVIIALVKVGIAAAFFSSQFMRR